MRKAFDSSEMFCPECYFIGTFSMPDSEHIFICDHCKWEARTLEERASLQDKFVYEKACGHCLRKSWLISGSEECPEYYTRVFLICKCDALVEFDLPVGHIF